jgi:RHS repeat-associated protein
VFLRARYYEPSIGRFISRDPILEPIQIGGSYVGGLLPYLNIISRPQSLHPYVYVRNNPIKFVDPFGLKSECEKWEEVRDTDDRCGGLQNAAQCAQCCVETFTTKLWHSPFRKWYGWLAWVYGCKSVCAASGGKMGPDSPTP